MCSLINVIWWKEHRVSTKTDLNGISILQPTSSVEQKRQDTRVAVLCNFYETGKICNSFKLEQKKFNTVRRVHLNTTNLERGRSQNKLILEKLKSKHV